MGWREFKNMDMNNPEMVEKVNAWEQERQKNRRLFGIGIALLGIGWIVCTILNITIDWSTQWPLILIIIGMLNGMRHGFKNNAWWILILIGSVSFLDNYTAISRNYLWGAGLVIVGVMMAIKPRRRSNMFKPKINFDNHVSTDADLNIEVVFGARKELVTSKEFKKGNVSVTFGGCELNMMQADFADTAILNVEVSFSGLELIVPSNWTIKNEVNPTFGNVEDERHIMPLSNGEIRKMLIIRGTCAFGNIEIKSY